MPRSASGSAMASRDDAYTYATHASRVPAPSSIAISAIVATWHHRVASVVAKPAGGGANSGSTSPIR